MIRLSKSCSGSALRSLTSLPSRLLATALLILSLPAAADEQASWTRYENGYFIAYSNAAGEAAATVLEALEYIRAAAGQVPGIVIPEGRDKTIVVLPATAEEFTRFAPYPTMAGFAQQLDGGAMIVMPVFDTGSDGDIVMRHEFAHTLLFNDWFRYPTWFAEGFAELASTIVVNRRSNRYTMGEMPRRYGRRFRPAVPWNDLLLESFDAHSLGDTELLQSAYAQNWLLFHYLTLNGEKNFALEIDRYFGLVNTGTPSTEAFLTAFGYTPAELWETTLADYAKEPPAVTGLFDPKFLDIDFSVTPAQPDTLLPLLTFLTDKADARRLGAEPQSTLDALPGSWDQLRFADSCSDPLEFTVVPAEDVVRIEGFYSAPGREPIPAVFLVESITAGYFRLVNVTADEYPNVVTTPDYQLSIRTDNVFCMDEMPVRQPCGSIFQRCGPR